MKHRVLAMALPFAAGLAFVGALAAAVGYTGAAWALVGCGLGVGLLALHVRLDDLGERTERRQSAHTAAMAGALSANAAAHTRQNARLRRELQHTRTLVEELPSDAVALQRLYGEIAPGSARLPTLGGWAATPRTILLLTDEIRRAQKPVTMLECGSGSSTLMAALQMRASGHLHSSVWSLESDPGYAEQTRATLRAHGVEQYATVVDAPIVDVELPDGEIVPWYDLSGLPELSPVTLLFVDGPIGTLAEQSRYPAFPLLADRLAETALVVLDDTNRPDERAIVERWTGERYAERGLQRLSTEGRATVMRAGWAEMPAPGEQPESAFAGRRRALPPDFAAPEAPEEQTTTPEEEAPAAEPPAAEAVAAPGDEMPPEEPAVEASAAEETAVEESPVAEAPAEDGEAPAQDEEAPAQDAPAAEAIDEPETVEEQPAAPVVAQAPVDPMADAPEETVRRSRFAPPQ